MRSDCLKVTTGTKLLASVAMLSVLAGCGGGRQLTAPFVLTPPSAEPDYIEVQSASFRCAKGDKSQPAVSEVIPGVAADFVISLGKELLKQMQEDRSAVYAATGEVSAGCRPDDGVTEGIFTVERSATSGSGDPYATPAFKLEGNMTLKVLESSAKPAQGSDSSKSLHIAFKATKVTYGRAAPKAGSGRKRVVLLVQFADQSAVGAGTQDAELSLTSPLRIDLGNLQEGYVYNENMLRHISTSVTIPYPKNPTPVITAVVFETERESVALEALSGAYDSNSDALADVLVRLLGGGSSGDQ